MGAPYGVRGLVRVATHTARPEDLVAYGPLHAGPAGATLDATLVRIDKGAAVVRIDGIASRDDAAALRGTRLCVPRPALPPPAGHEFYHHDLIGLRAELADGSALGVVAAVHDFGAGDVLEIAKAGGGTVSVAFTRDFVPVVDLEAGRIVIDRAAVAQDEP